MAVNSAVLAEAVTLVKRYVPGVEMDDWTPSVQGAVGHVVGMRQLDGSAYVLKIYPAAAVQPRETEVLAQRLLGLVPGVMVPRPLVYGRLSSSSAVGFVLMTRLEGVRWADLRAGLSEAQSTALTREAGDALRRVHSVPGRWFGDLSDGGSRWPKSWDRVAARTGELLDQYSQADGPPGLARRVLRFVRDHQPALASCPGPVLCHNDFIDANLLVSNTTNPHLCGVVDLERASWDDPLSDLAQTRLHVRYHDPADTAALTEAYGIDGTDECQRLDVYEVLHGLQERTWIAHDRPAGWQQSITALDTFLAAQT